MSRTGRERTIVGVLVGGRSSRMGGAPKGLLAAPDSGEPLVARLVRLARSLGLRVALVGDTAPYASLFSHTSAYVNSTLEIELISDRIAGLGPVGGIASLLTYDSVCEAIVLACDHPYVTAAFIDRLATTAHSGDVLAPKVADDAPWEPLCARWSANDRVRAAIDDAIARGDGSLQRLLARLDVTRLSIDDEERRALVDWDTPADVAAR